jgi:hypothetical protein
MGFLQPLSTWTDLVVVAFLLGIGAGALIFWPMVRKARHRLAAQRACTHSLSRGAHALRDPSALRMADSTTASATAVTVLTAHRRSPALANQADEGATDAKDSADRSMSDQANADLPTAPQPRISEPVAVPQLPTDLFEQHYEARFDHARKRIERLRAQLD